MPSLLATHRIAVHVEDHLNALGDVFAAIRGHDSGCTSYGVDVDQLRSAEHFHAAVAHPAIVSMRHAFDVPGARAIVYPWVPGEVLNDPLSPGGRPHAATDSALNRFRTRPAASIERVLDSVIDAHVTVAEHGFVAVDFYDGCLMHDAANEQVRLVDLDGYRPWPVRTRGRALARLGRIGAGGRACHRRAAGRPIRLGRRLRRGLVGQPCLGWRRE